MSISNFFANLESNIPRGKVRTRFAPSPTGYLHLGGLRTALYAYLLAKKEKGTFILRIEDTDQERIVDGAIQIIYDTLFDVGLNHDEGPDNGGPVGPYIQSERKEIYKAYIDLLIERGHAYRCFCDKESLEEQRIISKARRVPHKYDGRCMLLSDKEIKEKLEKGVPYVVRQKIPKTGVTAFDDLVHGYIEVENNNMDDSVLMKSDGMPTYNFANVIDDHLMGITHIVRGDEFLSSTPKYILLYQSFGWTPPKFIHCSPVMRDSQNKLSKRDGDAYYGDFIEKGYLKEAILNYVALLGWNPSSTKVLYTIDELIQDFDISGISKSPAIFDYKQLNWFNGVYLRALSDEAFHSVALKYIKKGVKRDADTLYIAKVIKERCEVLSSIPDELDFIDNLPEYQLDLYENKKMGTDINSSIFMLEQLKSILSPLTDWTPEVLKETIIKYVEANGLKNGQAFWPLRIALAGKRFTPCGAIEIGAFLGKDESFKRIDTALLKLRGQQT